MLGKDELKSRLIAWAQEYGGGRYENIGYSSRNMLAVLIAHKGFIPDSRGFIPVPIRTAADEVEDAVADMEKGGMFKPGRVVRCEFFLPHAPEEERLGYLKRIGIPMSRAGYYIYLGQGMAFLAAALDRRAAA